MDGHGGQCSALSGGEVDAALATLAEAVMLNAGNKDDLSESNLFASDEDLEDDETVIDNN